MTTNLQQQIPLMLQSKRLPNEAEISGFSQSVWEKSPDSYYKLEIAMNFLYRVDTDAESYTKISQKIMQHLQQEFQKVDEVFLPWVRFLDISALKKEGYPGKIEGKAGYIFKQGMENLVINTFTQNQTALTMDWRIAKKILNLPNLFPDPGTSRLLPLIAKDAILQAFQIEIDKAFGQMIWLPPTNLTFLAKRTLQIIRECSSEKSSSDCLSQAIIVGRFSKSEFDLPHSLILGEDGGLYLLLNRLTKEQQEDMVRENIVTASYLKDKIQAEDEKSLSNGDKVVLGQGGFGKVKFALSLFGGKRSPGDVVCIKKTKNFFELAPKNSDMIPSALHEATKATMDDYFASGVAEKVYAPQILDLAIVTASWVHDENDPPNRGCHQKGYLMMEVFPQNTATKIFRERKYQEWKYQKPFLQEILLSTSELLKERIAFTDLKPDNALFDPETFKTTIIDLGGTIKIDAADSLDNFDKRKYTCQITEGYCAPEMKATSGSTISLPKALAYTCGKVMEEVAQHSNYEQQELKELIDKLTNLVPEQRFTIEDALERLKKMGDDITNEDILLNHYIAKITGRIEHNRSSISLNEDILTTEELYIDLKITANNPEKFKDQKTEDLFQRIDHFLAGEQDQQQVMVIFGSAGSGKSIALQLKFIKAVQKWTKGQPLPIYFNLANGIDLKNIINAMNTDLDTNLKLQELKNDVHLYIDSFDEGLEIEKRRETLIKDYIAELRNSHTKILITCRSNYIGSEKDYSWFTPQDDEFDKLAVHYVAPMRYNVEREEGKNHSSWKKQFINSLERQSKKNGTQLNQSELGVILQKMAEMNLNKLLETGLMFHIVMEVLPELFEEVSQSRTRSKQNIYLKYVTKYQREELQKLTEEQKIQVTEYIKFISMSQKKEEFKLIEAIKDLGKHLAVQLHLQDKFRLDQDAPIFPSMKYENTIHFKKQALWHILKILPLKIETKHSSNNSNKIKSQEVKVGFIHDTIKNCYLLDAIQDEMSTQDGKSQILASKSIITDSEVVKFIADAAQHDDVLKTYLRKAIDFSKSDKSESASILAANCITILVSARYSFRGQNLNNINIRGANLKSGIFSGTDFTGANLSNTNLNNIQACEAIFRKTNLIGTNLGSIPESERHTSAVYSVSFSGDGKYVASGSGDNTVKIWEVQTNKCLANFEDHTDYVRSVSFSGDGRYVASAGSGDKGDKTVDIWEMETNTCLTTLEGHTDEVNSVSFSTDGEYVASGSGDKTVKIWEVPTHKSLALEGNTGWITSVSFSDDGRYLASGSSDSRVNIWEVQTYKCHATLEGHRSKDHKSKDQKSKDHKIKGHKGEGDIGEGDIGEGDIGEGPIVEGHTGEVKSVSFSGDGRYIASGSSDQTVKIWEVQTGKYLTSLEVETKDVPNDVPKEDPKKKKVPNEVLSVSFSGDGRYVASGSIDKTVKIWEVQTGKCLATLDGHENSVWNVSFSGDGRYVASASGDNTVKIWGVQAGNCLTTLQGHSDSVQSVSFSRDGKHVASGSHDKTVKIWEVRTNTCVATFLGHTETITSVSFRGDGKYVASGSHDKKVKIWEVLTNKCVATFLGHTETITSVSFRGDGKYVASGSRGQAVKIWKVQAPISPKTLEGHTGEVRSVSFSGDGRHIASGSIDKTVKIWEMQTGNCLASLQGHTDSVRNVSFSSNGRYVVSGSGDNTVKIWEVQPGKYLTTLQGHSDYVRSVSFSGDGKYIVSGSGDKTVKIWEVQTGKCLNTLAGHTSEVYSVSFRGDGSYIVSGSGDKTVRIWDVQTGEALPDLKVDTGEVRSVSFSGNGRYVAFAGSNDQGVKAVKIWEVQTGKNIAKFHGHADYVRSVSFSDDGKYVASGSGNNTVKIWEVQTGNCLSTLKGHIGEVKSVSFSIDGRYIASGSGDNTVKIWEMQTNTCLTTLQGHKSAVYSVSFSGERSYVASSSSDKTVKIWEVKTGKCLNTLAGQTSTVYSVSFSRDGRYVALGSGDKTVKIWEVKTGKCLDPLQGHMGEVRSVSFSGDGRYVASSSSDRTVKIWEVQTNTCLTTFEGHTSEVRCVSFSGDGRYAASGSADMTVKIWEITNSTTNLIAIEAHTHNINSVSMSNDGRYIVSGSSDKTVKVWEVQTHICLVTFHGHTGSVWNVSFSGDGRYVASASGDNTVKIWEVQAGNCLNTLQGHSDYVRSVSFSGDGKYIVSGSGDKTVKIWEVQTGKCLNTLADHTSAVYSVSFRGDGRYIVSGSGDYTVKIWEVQTRKCVATLEGHTGPVRSLGFSRDGRHVVSAGSSDKTVKVWEVQTNICLATLRGHTESVWDVSFSGDGRYVASSSGDNTVKIWEVKTENCLTTLKGHVDYVRSVSFSGDGRYLASSSDDQTVAIWTNNTRCWLLDALLSNSSELPLRMHDTIIDEADISTQKLNILKKYGAQCKSSNIATDNATQITQTSIVAQSNADKLNDQMQNLQIARDKKFEQQNLLQIDATVLPKQTEKNQKSEKQEALEQKEKADPMIIQQLQNAGSQKLSSDIRTKLDANNKTRVFPQGSIEKQQFYYKEYKKVNGNNREKSACCNLF